MLYYMYNREYDTTMLSQERYKRKTMMIININVYNAVIEGMKKLKLLIVKAYKREIYVY